ncbi:MAG: ATP-binding cassette domain-containing protein [Solirubrobacterales bacterium]|nr:ATP-binding cassette domain-containing protein [Solirubrobacterales bacterium]
MSAPTPTGGSEAEPMIRLEGLQKRFPGQAEPAVDDLSLDVPEGEIAVLVGPSGCGKTTTLKLINRLIEPTAGRIVIAGEDVTHADPDSLRRRIGYVIQQVGLFPHMTIAENIATVPQMLGWKGIDARVDELLELVGMEPATYRGRYPRELSGGQSQRVGVARALAADPPVLLMDEPFGAIDPITRERLQDEFLRLQGEVRKTIVFVTHDIDEAIKMGDRIALLRIGGRLAQYDRPQRLLIDPADAFVAEFIGGGARVKGLRLVTVDDVELTEWPTARPGDEAARVLALLRESDRGHALLLDPEGRPRSWLSREELGRNGRPLEGLGETVGTTVEVDDTLHQALDALLASGAGAAAVVDPSGRYRGVVDLATLAAAVAAMAVNGHRPAGAEAEAANSERDPAAGS